MPIEKLPLVVLYEKVIQEIKDPIALALYVYMNTLKNGIEIQKEIIMEHFGINKMMLGDALDILEEIGLIEFENEGKKIHVSLEPRK